MGEQAMNKYLVGAGRPIIIATLVAGTLDILSAFVFAGVAGMTPLQVLRFVASGPFGDAPTATPGWAAVGLAVHYAIMACMAAAYVLIAPRIPALMRHPIVAGIAYGFLLWIIMYWIVRPLRFPELPLPNTLYGIANALFSHCILVGIPIALIAKRYAVPR
ncbi:hypothetical protein [Sphingosinicella sp. BN140058]|uniref:hypothetical protein n=1 Tax=Sphingosinicella sp. BN140058 TaxID=1892855 RepID=UPI001FB0F68A|nr:hypothetical protein [Sphingosinicella sp. BN140058]